MSKKSVHFAKEQQSDLLNEFNKLHFNLVACSGETATIFLSFVHLPSYNVCPRSNHIDLPICSGFCEAVSPLNN